MNTHFSLGLEDLEQNQRAVTFVNKQQHHLPLPHTWAVSESLTQLVLRGEDEEGKLSSVDTAVIYPRALLLPSLALQVLWKPLPAAVPLPESVVSLLGQQKML